MLYFKCHRAAERFRWIVEKKCQNKRYPKLHQRHSQLDVQFRVFSTTYCMVIVVDDECVCVCGNIFRIIFELSWSLCHVQICNTYELICRNCNAELFSQFAIYRNFIYSFRLFSWAECGWLFWVRSEVKGILVVGRMDLHFTASQNIYT